MTGPTATANQPPANVLRSIGAILLGFVFVLVFSLGTDEVLRLLKVIPPLGQPMEGTNLYLLVTSYRLVYSVLGSYIAARFAPCNPMRHALILGVIGLPLGLVGVVFTIMKPDLGPLWYPVALVLTTMPCAWLGGVLHRGAGGGRAS